VIGERLNGLLARAIREEAAAKQRDTAALTDREKEILQGLAQGLPNKLIARNLDITEATVKVHVQEPAEEARIPLPAGSRSVGGGPGHETIRLIRPGQRLRHSPGASRRIEPAAGRRGMR